MSDPAATFVGHLSRLVVESGSDGDRLRLTVGRHRLGFKGVVGLVLGDGRDPLRIGGRSTVVLEVRSHVDAGWEAVSFRVANAEQDLPLSFYCASWSEEA